MAHSTPDRCGRRHGRWVRGLMVGVLLSACATTDLVSDRLRGTGGPVSWEIVGIRSVAAPLGQETRWTYTLILRNGGKERIQLESIETRAAGPVVGRGQLMARPQVDPFRATLDPDSEFRVNLSYGIAYTGPAPNPAEAPGHEGIEVTYRLRGADAAGRPVTVAVRIHLDSSVGRTGALPRQAPEAPEAPEESPPSPSPAPPHGDVAVLWEVARQCERRFPGVETVQIGRDGALQIQSPAGADREPFFACFRTGADERLAGRVAWPSGSSGTTVVGLKFVDGNILVPVTINSRYETRLILDTGAAKTILSPGLLARISVGVPEDAIQLRLSGLAGESVTVSLARVERLTVGEATIEDLYVGAHSVPVLPRGAEGLLGADFLRHFQVSVDQGAQRLRLEVAP